MPEGLLNPNEIMQEEHGLYNMSAERALLAICMAAPEVIDDVAQAVKPEDFFFEPNRYVWKVMHYIAEQCVANRWPVAVDPMSMLGFAKRLGPEFEASFTTRDGGLKQARMIEALIPEVSKEQVSQYVSLVKDHAARVALYRQARTLQLKVISAGDETETGQLAMDAETALSSIAWSDERPQLVRLSDADAAVHLRCRLACTYPDRGLFNVEVPHFPHFMRMQHGGYRRRGLSIIAARPKTGKSTLLLYQALMVAVMRNTPVLYLDSEMSLDEMHTRALSCLSGVSEGEIMKGTHLRPEQTQMGALVAEARRKLDAAPFHYLQIAGMPTEHVISQIRQWKHRHIGVDQLTLPDSDETYECSRPGLICYDWLKLPDMSALNAAKEYQLLGFIASSLKDVANELDLPIIAAAQANRNAVGADDDEWMDIAESFVGASDRLAQFCTLLAMLRNVNRKEMDLQKLYWSNNNSPFGLDDEGEPKPAFNQLLHVILHRGGGTCEYGIPLMLHRGFARYAELQTPAVKECRQWMAQQGKRAKTGASALAQIHQANTAQVDAAFEASPAAPTGPATDDDPPQ
jgi:replicative DNA helicase